ncbi:MAG TPA: cohesin domain-containing protein, partial [Candidatus Cloacimonadota bacterium]|nr:cohesin domain-containing protein [Candidatus Cloacimonadota bacterium]
MKLKYLLLLIFAFSLLCLNAQNAALYFDGNRDYVSIPNSLNAGLSGATGFTFETWIKPSSLANGSPVDSHRNTIVDFSLSGTTSVLAMYLREGGKIRFGGRSRNLDAFQDVVTSNPVIVTGSWQHVAGVLDFSGKKIFLYVDGALVASRSGVLFGSNTFVTQAGGSKFIGCGIALDVNHGYHGSMDETRFWTTPRTEAEIYSSMANPVSSQAWLLGYWKFDNNALDSSGYGFDGTLYGDCSYSEPYLSGLYIYAVPVQSEANVGDYVELEVRLEGFPEPMRGYEIALSIDPLYLRLESPDDIRKGDLLSSNGLSQLLSTSVNGVITVTETILGPCSGVTQSGSLFFIKLKALAHTTDAGTPFTLDSAILRTPLNADIFVTEMLGATVVIDASSFLIPLHTGWNL